MLSPIIAILRGLDPAAAHAVGEALVSAGVQSAEVPLNRPGALESLAILRQAVGGRLRLGAGTVLTVDQVREAEAAGAAFIVSPNANPAVIGETRSRGLASVPGVFTATEAFSALDAGANALKLFPADALGPGGLRALATVLPDRTPIYAVGGVDVGSVAGWRDAGAAGLGIGSHIYREGRAAKDVETSARAFIQAWEAAAR